MNEIKKVFYDLGQKIRKIRKEKNITIKELSLKTGININYLYKVERGKAFGICIDRLGLIASCLEVRVYELF